MHDIASINPATEEVLARYPLMDEQQVREIIAAMAATQKEWRETPLALRQQCLARLAQLLLDNKEQYAALMTSEMGKPIVQAQAEIEKCAKLCAYYAVEGPALLQPEIIQTEFYQSYRTYQPLGIVFAIMPWNFPFWQVMRFAVPNLMLGNAGLLKHAPNVMGVALQIEKLMVQAGFPQHLFRCLVIDIDLAPMVIHHPSVIGVTLTGSNRAGKMVAKEAGAALKKVVLELGGSDPYVVLEDADLDHAATQCVTSRLNNAGQVCIAAKRIIVVEKVKAEFEALILEKAKAYAPLGPMARADLRANIHEQVTKAIASGARCVLGGVMPSGPGYFYPATVLFDVPTDSVAFCEEMFGPVICVTGAKNEAEALDMANMTEFGLGAAIFTRDLEKGNQLAATRLQAGTCAVNVLVASDPRLPFGGIKQSGYGRELSREGMHEFANIKTVIVAK